MVQVFRIWTTPTSAWTVIACSVVDALNALVRDELIEGHYGIWKAEQIGTDPCVSSSALNEMAPADGDARTIAAKATVQGVVEEFEEE